MKYILRKIKLVISFPVLDLLLWVLFLIFIIFVVVPDGITIALVTSEVTNCIVLDGSE